MRYVNYVLNKLAENKLFLDILTLLIVIIILIVVGVIIFTGITFVWSIFTELFRVIETLGPNASSMFKLILPLLVGFPIIMAIINIFDFRPYSRAY